MDLSLIERWELEVDMAEWGGSLARAPQHPSQCVAKFRPLQGPFQNSLLIICHVKLTTPIHGKRRGTKFRSVFKELLFVMITATEWAEKSPLMNIVIENGPSPATLTLWLPFACFTACSVYTYHRSEHLMDQTCWIFHFIGVQQFVSPTPKCNSELACTFGHMFKDPILTGILWRSWWMYIHPTFTQVMV